MNKKKLFRALVCFVVICCLIVNISPVRSKALATELTVAGALGVIAWAYLAWAGCVYVPANMYQIEAIGNTLQDELEVKYGDSPEMMAQIEEDATRWHNMLVNWPDAPEDPHRHDLLVKASRGMLTTIAGLAVAGILGKLDIEAEDPESEAPEGQAYFSDVLLSDLPDAILSYPYLILRYDSYGYSLAGSVNRGVYSILNGKYTTLFPSGQRLLYQYSANTGEWILMYDNVVSFAIGDPLLWANFDVCYEDGTLHFAGSDISYYKTTFVEPSTYVGDIPQQVQDGTMTAEDIVLPETINLGSILTSPETIVEDITDTAQQLADGTITYNDYITNITYNQTADPDEGETTEPTTGTDPDPGGDPDSGEDSDTNIDDYVLDLTDFFPFCIPFDIYEFLSIMDAEPEAPYMEFDVDLPIVDTVWHLVIDLSAWDGTAQLLRRLELLLFIVGLAMVTRNHYIRG